MNIWINLFLKMLNYHGSPLYNRVLNDKNRGNKW